MDVVYIGIDSLSYTKNPSQHNYQPSRCPYQYLMSNSMRVIELYINLSLSGTPLIFYGRKCPVTMFFMIMAGGSIMVLTLALIRIR